MNPMKGISTRQRWYCPSCQVAVTTYVQPKEPPTHPCQKKGRRMTNLQLEKEENK